MQSKFMVPTVNDVIEELFSWAPRGLAEEWDNVGLQVGYPFWPVKKAVVSLDVTPVTLAFALEVKADIVISHHPLIFTHLTCLNLNETTARLLAGFLRHEISVCSMHTNLDAARGGVNDCLASLLGIEHTEPLLANSENMDAGLGRIGVLPQPISRKEFLNKISSVLQKTCLATAGSIHGRIDRVALCSGSGSSLFQEAAKRGAQCFVSAEIKHSTAREAEAQGILVVDAGHFETERPIVYEVEKFLKLAAREKAWELQTAVIETEQSPFTFWNTEKDY
jgi:dinuclear metal center YbgI/SA1388 family protein